MLATREARCFLEASGGVDALKPDAVLGVGVIEDGDAVGIGDFDDFAGESVGEGR